MPDHTVLSHYELPFRNAKVIANPKR